MPPKPPLCHLSRPSSHQCLRTQPRMTLDPESRARPFHHSSPRHGSKLRREMFEWLNGPGKAFRDPRAGRPNYLGAIELGPDRRQKQQKSPEDRELDEAEEKIQERELSAGVSQEEIEIRAQARASRRAERKEAEEKSALSDQREMLKRLRPYPWNQNFRSQAVLSEELRERIFRLITEDGHDLKSVSAAFGVDVRRVAAVVRLKSVEKEWIEQGKKLATPYNEAILSMLPQTPYQPEPSNRRPHESINDLPVHSYTRQQLFLSTSESRHFSREDAAKAFHPNLLSADKRIQHPELLQMAKWATEGHGRETRQELMQEKDAEALRQRQEKERKQKEWEARTQVVVPGRRWDFKFQDFSAEKVGKDGRARGAVGARYGMPHEDRKKGQMKIPTSVE